MGKVNKRHSNAERGRDAYFTPSVAVHALLDIECEYIPENIYEPAVGDGAIASILERRGYSVYCADIYDYGYPNTVIEDYLATGTPPPWVEAVVTNPPYRYAKKFCERAVEQVDYVAMLLRIGFLESLDRQEWLNRHPPTRILVPARRLPMMHRLGWEGPKNEDSNVCHPWFIWDKSREQDGMTELLHYDWQHHNAGQS